MIPSLYARSIVLISVSEALKLGTETLRSAKTETAWLDASLLLTEATGLTRTEQYTKNERMLSNAEYSAFTAFIERRKQGEPVAYITGRRDFLDYSFRVTKHTLIPRPETEILTDTAIKLIDAHKLVNIIEIGTGSGCIAVSLKKSRAVNILATDISKAALETARQNSADLSADVYFAESDLFSAISHDYGRKIDMIVSNPPYIETEFIKTLDGSVKDYEPLTALDGGEDGLKFYAEITKDAPNFLRPGGFLIYEIGYNQKESVTEILINNNFKNVVCIKDLSGKDRVVYGNLEEVNNV